MRQQGNTKTAILVFVLLMVAVMLAISFAVVLLAPGVMEGDFSIVTFTRSALLQNILLAGVVLLSLLVYTDQVNPRAFLQERRKRKGRKLVRKYVCGSRLAYIVCMGFLSYGLDVLGWTIPGLNGEQSLMTTFSGFGLSMAREYVSMVALVALIGPLMEEVLYRSFLTDILLRYGPFLAIFLSGLLFALTHVEMAVFFNLAIMGWILGYIYRKTQSAWYPFLFHMIINSISLAVLFFAPGLM